jgi:hypothetical protein
MSKLTKKKRFKKKFKKEKRMDENCEKGLSLYFKVFKSIPGHGGGIF